MVHVTGLAIYLDLALFFLKKVYIKFTSPRLISRVEEWPDLYLILVQADVPLRGKSSPQ